VRKKENWKLFLILLLVLSFAITSCGKKKSDTRKNAKATVTEFMQKMTKGDAEGAKALATKESGPVVDEMADAGKMPIGAEFSVESVSEGDSTAEAMVIIGGKVQSLQLIEMPDGSWLVSYVASVPEEVTRDSSTGVNEELPEIEDSVKVDVE